MGKAGDDLISSLQSTNSELATKLQTFQDELESMKESGASKDEIRAKQKEQLDSLSQTDQDTVKQAFEQLMEKHRAQEQSQQSSSQGQLTSLLQGISAYTQNLSGYSNSTTSSLAVSFA